MKTATAPAVKACRHKEIFVSPGFDFATGGLIPGPTQIWCLQCGERLVEDEDGVLQLQDRK